MSHPFRQFAGPDPEFSIEDLFDRGEEYLYTVSTAAKILKIDRRKLARAVSRGKVPSYTASTGAPMVKLADVLAVFSGSTNRTGDNALTGRKAPRRLQRAHAYSDSSWR